jgi:hypothetical protein
LNGSRERALGKETKEALDAGLIQAAARRSPSHEVACRS